MKYRKKAVVVDAVQWFKPGDDPRVYFRAPDKNRCWEIAHPEKHEARPVVDSKEGWHFIEPGYWIITGVEGETYGCSPSVFAKTYESADDPRHAYVSSDGRYAVVLHADGTTTDLIAENMKDAARYRAWRDGDVIVRRCDGGWEARHESDPHWDVGSWAFNESLDEAIDTAMRYGREGHDISKPSASQSDIS